MDEPVLQERDASLTGLVEVFSAWFRTFGYATRLDATLTGASGSHHQVPLVAELDARRIGVYAWTRTEAPANGFFESIRSSRHDTGLDEVLILCLGTFADTDKTRLAREQIHLWDRRRVVQELGEAVLAETCPETVSRADPLLFRAPRRAEAPAEAPVPTLPAPPKPMEVVAPPSPAPPILATREKQLPTELQVPPAFDLLDVTTASAAVAAAPTPSPAPATPANRSERATLRPHVSKALALSLVRNKIKRVDRVLLRLTPFHVYNYEANLLLGGSLDAQTRKGRMAVDAANKRVQEWTVPLETGEVAAEGADVDEKRIRVDAASAESTLRQELVKLITRDVVMEEDGDEWSVVVKKKVELAPNDINLEPLGVYWLPIWRLSGKEGSMEIDATSGTVIFEEIVVERTDSQLI